MNPTRNPSARVTWHGNSSSEDVTDSEEDEHEEVAALRTEFHARNVQRLRTTLMMVGKTTTHHEVTAVRASFKVPDRWILAFGCTLAFAAGIVDVVGINLFKICVANMTGNAASIGTKLEGWNAGEHSPYDVFFIVSVVLAFVFGAFLCGLIIPSASVHFGGKEMYGTALLGNATLLSIAALLTIGDAASIHKTYGSAHYHAGVCLAACASGLQNAMCTLHFGTVVRTTHVTGTLTDIGSLAGKTTYLLIQKLRSHDKSLGALQSAQLEVDAKKLGVLTVIFLAFTVGCTAGAFILRHMEDNSYALFVPACITGLLGIIYTFLRQTLKKYFKNYERGQTREAAAEILDGLLSALQLRERGDDNKEEEEIDHQVEELTRIRDEQRAATIRSAAGTNGHA